MFCTLPVILRKKRNSLFRIRDLTAMCVELHEAAYQEREQ